MIICDAEPTTSAVHCRAITIDAIENIAWRPPVGPGIGILARRRWPLFAPILRRAQASLLTNRGGGDIGARMARRNNYRDCTRRPLRRRVNPPSPGADECPVSASPMASLIYLLLAPIPTGRFRHASAPAMKRYSSSGSHQEDGRRPVTRTAPSDRASWQYACSFGFSIMIGEFRLHKYFACDDGHCTPIPRRHALDRSRYDFAEVNRCHHRPARRAIVPRVASIHLE